MDINEFEKLYSDLISELKSEYMEGNHSILTHESELVKQIYWQNRALKTIVRSLILTLADSGKIIPLGKLDTIYAPPAKVTTKPANVGPATDITKLLKMIYPNSAFYPKQSSIITNIEDPENMVVKASKKAPPPVPSSVKIVKKPKFLP